MAKALVLMSGGLDSTLAAKILLTQDIAVEGLCFASNFYGSEKAEAAADCLGVKLNIINIHDEMLGVVKNPPSGYGKNMNPCLDCHAYMIKRAGEFARLSKEDNKFDFIATGEVLGQRPFSQTKRSLERVRRYAGVDVLRPLSAKLLEETEAEKKGLVSRGRLYRIEGRNREEQMALAEKFGITEYPSPSGGCLLTDPEFSQRLLKMLSHWPGSSSDDIELLKNGRIFWFRVDPESGADYKMDDEAYVLVVVGRSQKDNDALAKIRKSGDVIVELADKNGPTTLIRNLNTKVSTIKELKMKVPDDLQMSLLKVDKKKSVDEVIGKAALLTGYYATKFRGEEVEIALKFD